MKRTLCLFLALILAVGICFSAPVTITASAAEAVTSGNCGASTNEGGESSVTWKYDSAKTTLTISGTGAMEDYSYDNNPWESYRNEMTNVIISNGVTSIGIYAFYKCTLLASIEIPQSVTTIEKDAFYGCSALETVIIPDSVTTIGEYAFSCCTALVTVKLGKGITTMGGYIFRDCVSLKSVTISEGVTTIERATFWGCSALETVIIPDSVTKIGEFAFRYCKGLETIILPDKLTIIGSGAFNGCSSLVSITIPISVTEISGSAFEECTSLASVNAPCSWNEKPLYKFKSGVTVTIQSHTLENNVCIICSENKCGTSESDNVVWFLDDGVLYISGTGAMADYGANNTPWKDYTTQIKKVVVGDGVTSIGNYAFYGCTALTSVIISGSVTRLGDKAFWNCASLTSVTIPESVTTIGYSAFEECASLTSINVNENNTVYASIDGVLFNKEKTEIIRCPQNKSGEYSIPESVITIGGSAFSGCEALTSVIIPDSVTTIGRSAFWGCSALNLIEIPKNVTTIGESAFTSCSALTSVIIPDNVTTIGALAFWNCDLLASVTIPESVTTIGDSAFVDCASLTSINVNENNTAYASIDGVLFNKEKTEIIRYPQNKSGEYSIPESVTTIDSYAFDGCTSLTTVNAPCSWNENPLYTFEDGVDLVIQEHTYENGKCTVANCDNACAHETITDGVCVDCGGKHCGNTENDKVVWFYDGGTLTITGSGAMADYSLNNTPWGNYKSSITQINIENGVTTIGEGAFKGCSELASVTIPDSITTIGSSVFNDCTSLTTIEIPDSVTSIGRSAFSTCTALTSVMIPESVTTIDYCTFYFCTALKSVTIPESVTSIGSYAFSGCTSLTSVTIPESVTSIGSYAFDCCAKLTSIKVVGANTNYLSVDGILFNAEKTELICYPAGKKGNYEIPTTVTEIAPGAFSGNTSLESVIIPDSVTTIGEGAFTDCTALTSVTIPDSVTTIGSYAFQSCTSLTSVTIGDRVTTIGWQTFYDCTALTSVTIGKGVTEIDDYAFEGCEDVNLIVEPGSYAHEFAKTNSIPYIFNGCITKEETDQIEKLTFALNEDSKSYSVTGCDQQISGELKIPATYNGKPVTEIGFFVFSNCTSLASVTIPDSITTIGDFAFHLCTDLISITIPESVTAIGSCAFDDCAKLTSINVDGANTKYSSVDGILFNAEKTELICYPAGQNAKSYTVPESVTTIDDYAFHFCTALTSVIIPDSVTTIGDHAFCDCSELESVTIGNGVTEIDDYAFDGCNNLSTVNVPCDWDTENPPYAFDENVLKKYHNIVIDEAKAPTCTATGLTEG
ncbi:MAG: leucine-rich repeat domain-containing protein, partial [Clostridia bacterium]|nr:leucine-rich repeat domain-containing protein [Clostridia bacterium]